MRFVRKHRQPEADLDITSFMNLMIILVPVLLMSMVFSQITVLDLRLPDMASMEQLEDPQEARLELVIHEGFIDVNYPLGVRLKRIERLVDLSGANTGESAGESATAAQANGAVNGQDAGYDLQLLSQVLQQVKRQLRERGIVKRDISVLSQPDTDYQTIVSVMDTVRSFKAVVAASVVDAELFPEISLGDAPLAAAAEKPASAGGRQ